jgi:hypothetical protein
MSNTKLVPPDVLMLSTLFVVEFSVIYMTIACLGQYFLSSLWPILHGIYMFPATVCIRSIPTRLYFVVKLNPAYFILVKK